MSLKNFFVLFCSKQSVKPTIFKTKATIDRHLVKNPILQFKKFDTQQSANSFLAQLQATPNINSSNTQTRQLTPEQKIAEARQKIQDQISNKAFQDRITKLKEHFLLKYFLPAPLLRQPVPSKINLFFDGSSRINPGPSAIGYIAKTAQNKPYFKKGWGIGYKTNNQAEFCALTWGLLDCAIKGIPEVNVFGDSLLIINAMLGLYTIKNNKLIEYYNLATEIQKLFIRVNYSHIDRSLNYEADHLARTVTDYFMQKQ